jgi:hypothetical protein
MESPHGDDQEAGGSKELEERVNISDPLAITCGEDSHD